MNKIDKLQIRIDNNLKKLFKEKCEKQGYNMNQVIESMIRKMILDSK